MSFLSNLIYRFGLTGTFKRPSGRRRAFLEAVEELSDDEFDELASALEEYSLEYPSLPAIIEFVIACASCIEDGFRLNGATANGLSTTQEHMTAA